MFRPWQFLPLLLAAAVALSARAASPMPTRAGNAPAPATSANPAEPLPPEPSADLIPDHGAASTTFAKFWTGAFVTGNGTMGAMVMGANTSVTPPRPQEDSIFFSHNRLYLPLGTKEVVPQLGDSLTQVRQLIRTRGYGPAIAAAQAAAQKQGYTGPMYPDPYVPALELRLKMPAAGMPRDYLRTENFATGEVATRWTDDAGTCLRKIFVSRADNLAVLWIGPADTAHDAAKPRTVSCELWIPPIPGVPVRTYQLNNPAAAPTDSAANALILRRRGCRCRRHVAPRPVPRRPGKRLRRCPARHSRRRQQRRGRRPRGYQGCRLHFGASAHRALHADHVQF